jgi:stage II sporulation protein D
MSSLEVEVWLTEPRRIESVALEEYVSGVVAAEMSADFPDEALKAQAIAARTYIVRHLLNNPGEPVTDTTQQQAYTSRDIAQNLAGFDRIQAATLATAGQILLYEDEPIEALYFSTSNGYTANGEDYYEGANLPYLRSVASPWDEAISPQYEQTQTFSAAQVRRLLDLTEQQLAEMTITQRTSGGYVQTVTAGRQQRTGRAVREALGLASADFTWSFDGDHVTFTTLGYGHGVGMSQYGARGMAADGNRYQEILAYYYPSTELVTISKI